MQETENSEKTLPQPSASSKQPPAVPSFRVDVGPSCSWNECANGHRWPPTLAIGTCPACQTPAVAMQLDACPVCNEPAEKVRLRHDHTPRGGGVPPACTGVYGRSDVLEVMLTRTFPVEAGPQPAAPPEAI